MTDKRNIEELATAAERLLATTSEERNDPLTWFGRVDALKLAIKVARGEIPHGADMCGGVAQGVASCGTDEEELARAMQSYVSGQPRGALLYTGYLKIARHLLDHGADGFLAALESAEAVVWQPIETAPEVGRKFICLWDDGSGAIMYWRHDHGYIDHDGDECTAVDWSKIDCWAYLPDNFKFWCERGREAMTLTAPSSVSSTEQK